jgi:copper resistance protein C
MNNSIRRTLQALGATFFSLGLLLLAFVGTASAHAKVLQSDPGINSTIATAPTSIMVTTAENINPDPKKSNLFVYSPNGDLISQGDASVSLNNPKNMSIKIKPDGNGIYVVRWITVSADDGDPDEGAYVFTVKAGATTTTTTATPVQPVATAINTSSSVAPAVITGIIALLVGLGAGFAFGRNRTTPAAFSSAKENTPEDVTSGTGH